MPVIDKPLPQHPEELESGLWPNGIVSQIREATYSPSPLIRILHDPSILPSDSRDYAKLRRDGSRKGTSKSRSPRRGREHRTEVVAALAIAEEEKRSRQLKNILRSSGERLEYEIKRADAATLRADIAERQERIYLARAQEAEGEKDEIRKVCNGLEMELRNHQIQLEASQRELKLLHADLGDKRREMEELQNSEEKAQADARRCRSDMNGLQAQFAKQNLEVQNVINEWHRSGRETGYEEGYDEGYEAGRKTGLKEGTKKGRKEGNAETIHQPTKDDQKVGSAKAERIRRWVDNVV